MTTKNDGAPAFPCAENTNDPGMPLRAYIATQAMSGILISIPYGVNVKKAALINEAICFADEMIRQLNNEA